MTIDEYLEQNPAWEKQTGCKRLLECKTRKEAEAKEPWAYKYRKLADGIWEAIFAGEQYFHEKWERHLEIMKKQNENNAK